PGSLANEPAPTSGPGAAAATTAAPIPPAVPSLVPPSAPPSAPHDAADALDRTRAAYEYGDIDQVVQFARMVAEGAGGLNPTAAQQAHALRYLGIGLFLTGRREGAETAFLNLLRLRPDVRLDPRSTRPDVVAFFETVRRRHADEISSAPRENPKTFIWNLLPPIGQFQNGHRTRGITIGGIEFVSLATAITTKVLLSRWRLPNDEFADPDQAKNVRSLNYAAVAVFVAAYAYGVIDGIAHYIDPPDDETNDGGGGTRGVTAMATTIDAAGARAGTDAGACSTRRTLRAPTAARRWQLTPAGFALTF
ncbi:MAG: hypothetical protein ABUS79_30000, partial [Pseudomonadota bacterium]